MGSPRFDPAHAVQFKIDHGIVELDGARLLVPAPALLELCRAAGAETTKDFGRTLGTEAGRRVKDSLGDSGSASVESVLEHLAGNFALLGLGGLSLERWGRALVFVLRGSPLGSAGDSLITAVLEGALQRGLGRDTAVLAVERNDDEARYLVIAPSAAKRVREWIADDVPFGEMIVRLHVRRGAA